MYRHYKQYLLTPNYSLQCIISCFIILMHDITLNWQVCMSINSSCIDSGTFSGKMLKRLLENHLEKRLSKYQFSQHNEIDVSFIEFLLCFCSSENDFNWVNWFVFWKALICIERTKHKSITACEISKWNRVRHSNVFWCLQETLSYTPNQRCRVRTFFFCARTILISSIKETAPVQPTT